MNASLTAHLTVEVRQPSRPQCQALPTFDASHNDRVSRSDDVDDNEQYVETVLALVEQIPPGQATTYGLLAEAVGRGGPRQVGRVMATYGGPVPWWRVVRADGSLPDFHQRAALSHYREEATPLLGSVSDARRLRVDLAAAVWIPPDRGSGRSR
jgi:alkylated DNA nucleotide flippase Atl1